MRVGQACLRQAPVPWSGTGVLACPVVPPVLGPASSLINTLAVMCIAATRANPLIIMYHTHTPAGRGLGGNRPRPEQSQLNPASTA
jgi:hypothetical protein